MRPAPHKWPNTAAGHGVLMFSQLLREMLTDQSFLSFRAYSLDTTARLDEAIALSEDIGRNLLPFKALDPVKEELDWSLKRDPVSKDLVHDEVKAFADLKGSDKTPLDGIKQHLVLLKKRLGGDYKTLCEQKILAVFADEKKRIELRQITGFYCSHLLNLGYSKSFLLRQVERTFFTSPLQRVGKRTLTRFFRTFDCSTKSFHVYTPVSADFGKFLSKLGHYIFAVPTILPARLGPGAAQFIQITPDCSYLMSKEAALDEDTAVAQVETTLTNARGLAFIAPHIMDFNWESSMYVSKVRSIHGEVLKGQAPPLQRTLASPSAARREVRSIWKYSDKMLTNFDQDSTDRILNSLNTSAMARTSTSVENQLISLWSAVEVLLSAPPRETARILHYTKLLPPCICLRYIRRQIVAVFNEMMVVYRKEFSKIVNLEAGYGSTDQHTKFAAILCMPNNDALRDKLLTLCSDNPLAQHRLWKLHRDYSSPAAIDKALTGHENRVEWQLHRIYRARNNLVHAGRKPGYLDSLVLNLDEYYRECIGTLVNRASREDAVSHVDQQIAEIGIEYRIKRAHMAALKKKEKELSVDTFLRAVL